MKIAHAIALLAFSFSALCGDAAETLWDFVAKTTVRATEYAGSDPDRLRNDWGYIEWYSDGSASGDDYHVIGTGFSIEQITYPNSKRSTTITPNGCYLLTYGGRVAVADYGQVINRTFFETLAPDLAFEATWDSKIGQTVTSTSITVNDNMSDAHIGYLVFEDKSFFSAVNGYAWVEYSLYRGEFSVLDSGLVYGGDSSIVVGTHDYTYVGPIPEPTSGMLLLVGSAMLVIRRRKRT